MTCQHQEAHTATTTSLTEMVTFRMDIMDMDIFNVELVVTFNTRLQLIWTVRSLNRVSLFSFTF